MNINKSSDKDNDDNKLMYNDHNFNYMNKNNQSDICSNEFY